MVRISDTEFWVLNDTDNEIERVYNPTPRQLTSGKDYESMVRVSDDEWWLLNDTDDRKEHWYRSG